MKCDLNAGLQICRHSPDREVALMIVMAYLSYMMAEVRYICFVPLHSYACKISYHI